MILSPQSSQARQGHNRPIPEGVSIVGLDYSSVDNIADVLRNYEIEAVVSALNLDFETIASAQVNLIRGASQAGTVKRFIPSDFNVDYNLPDE